MTKDVEGKLLSTDDAIPYVVSSTDFGKLKTFIVSTVGDKYEIKENIIADEFSTAAKIFAEYYHGYKRDISHNDVFVNVENNGIVKKFKLMAEIKVNYWARFEGFANGS